MLTASVLLLFLGLLGAFDVAWFHHRQAALTSREECRAEAVVHVVRGVVYAAQFALVPNVRFAGRWALVLFGLFAVDAAVAAADVLLEPSSRKKQGGLPPGEYFMHVVLSVLAGALLHAALGTAWRDAHEPTSLAWSAQAPDLLRAALAVMSAASLGVALLEAAALLETRLPSPRPIHVSVCVPATRTRLWEITQDHHIHPQWDHRFDHIEMLGERIETGTTMRYTKAVLGVTISGWGRYKLHKPLVQSTFAFGSDDRRSLIREGVGLWRYRDVAPGVVELATSYTYAVRWGLFGRIFDRLVFRPLFQLETERSFRRLAREWFGVAKPAVLGAVGRRPARQSALAA
ncbi:MAG: hypothetical protein JWP97_3971 [Labilithrix sp.]|nr:hypothetical protein [Labilithrix sp.]